MDTKTIVAGIAGGLTLFVMGFIIYVLLLADFFTLGVEQDPPGFLLIVLGEIAFGLLLAWIFSRMGTHTIAGGARDGALVGFLISLGFGLIMLGASTIGDVAYYLSDAIAWAVRWAVAGAVVGSLLGRQKKVVTV